MNKIIAIGLLTLLLTGCGTSLSIKDDRAKMEPMSATYIAEEWANLIGDRYSVTTVFSIHGQGPIGKALGDALRSRGFGITTPTNGTGAVEQGIPVDVRSDNIGKKGVLVSLVVGEQIINRSYHIDPEGTSANSQFTQLNTKGID